MLNECNFIGRLTREIELKFTPNGSPVGNFVLAINKKWTDKDSGEARENVVFPEFNIWGSAAENLSKFATKGSLLYVKGEYTLQAWEDKEGQKRTSPKFRVINFQLLNGFKEALPPKTEEDNEVFVEEKKPVKKQSKKVAVEEDYEDDVPF